MLEHTSQNTQNIYQRPEVYIPATQLVESGRPYWVQCPEFSCWAVVDKAGRWTEFNTGKNLPDVINVFR